jgi:methylenetetrahydrofolate dehydrogenase (NADP+)/methenyltetrahydrofolate cyclohydrolase
VPRPIDKRAAFEAIPIEKDVDGVSSAALGRMILGMPAFAACTPKGIMTLLDEYDVDLDGADVTLCHTRTRGLSTIVRRADLLIAALGRPRFIQGDWIKPGAVVIDAGYNEGNVGDVEFEPALERVSLITPVPGGVGPMTIATLIDQTADAAAMQLGVSV